MCRRSFKATFPIFSSEFILVHFTDTFVYLLTESEGSEQERDWEEQQIRKGTNMPQVMSIMAIYIRVI